MLTMDFLVVSDTHGRYQLLDTVLNNQLKLPEAFRPKHLIHLGDGVSDIEKCCCSSAFCIHKVRGNCDGFFISHAEKEPKERLLEFFGHKMLIMHGDAHSVKSGDLRAVEYAAKLGADVLMYGHTHMPLTYTLKKGQCVGGTVLERDMTVLNPGSLGHGGSFCVVSVNKDQVVVSHGKI